MKGFASTSRFVLAIALVNLAVTGCGRKEANETGAASSPTAPSSTAQAPAAPAPDTGASSSPAAPTASADSSTGTAPAPATSANAPQSSSPSSAAPGSAPAASSGSSTAPGSSASGAQENDSSGATGSSGSSSTVGTAIDDTVLTTKVKSALMADAGVKSSDIKVETKKGEVQLSGFVASQQQVDKAVQVASAVEGVKKVDNKLTVKR